MAKIESNFKFPDINGFIIDIEDLISFNFTLQNVTFSDFSINPNTPPLMNFIENNRMILSVGDFKGHVKADYQFITDPPILADIGSLSFSSDNLTFSIDGTNTFNDGILDINLHAFTIDMQPFVLDLDGISDLSEVVTSLVNTVGNTLRGRVSSMSYYPPALAKINKLLNTVLAHIPDEIFISDDMYIQGNLDDSLLSTKG